MSIKNLLVLRVVFASSLGSCVVFSNYDSKRGWIWGKIRWT